MHVFIYNHRVLYCRMVYLSQLCLILLSGYVAVNPGPLRLGFTNCCSIRNKGPLLAAEVKSGGYYVFVKKEQLPHIKQKKVVAEVAQVDWLLKQFQFYILVILQLVF